jgi:hypothetical protein
VWNDDTLNGRPSRILLVRSDESQPSNASIKLALSQDRNLAETVRTTSFRFRDYLLRFALTDTLEPPGGLGQSGIAVRVAGKLEPRNRP